MTRKNGVSAVHRRSVGGLALMLVAQLSGCAWRHRDAGDPALHPTSVVRDAAGETAQPSQPAPSVHQTAFTAGTTPAAAGNPGRLAVSPANAAAVQREFTAENETTDLEFLVAQAVAAHPKIVAARQRVAAFSHRVPQATALDNPLFNNTFWSIQDQALQTAGGRMAHQFALSQKVPWPEKRTVRGDVASREVWIAQAEVAKAEREIIEAVQLAYYELWLADALTAIVEENKEVVGDLLTVAEARNEAGGPQRDVLRAQLEADKLEEQLIQLRRQKEQARADLGALVRQPVDLMPTAYHDLQIAETIPELEYLVARAEQCNPSLRGLAAEIARDRAKERLACLEKYPDLQLGLGYAILDDNTNALSPVANGHDNLNFTLGVTLPIWRDRIDAGVREAAHQRSSSISRREAERDRLRGQLRRQVAATYAAIEQLDLFRNRLVPRTEQALEVALADYQGKRADFKELVDIYRELLSYQVQVARTKATLAGTLAQIERLVGSQVDMSVEFAAGEDAPDGMQGQGAAVVADLRFERENPLAN
ncbi:MAG: TolC family protein [Planctomycetales bacterium]|nr:TolC family protein [Planctomycetales bacterium]